MIRDVVSYLDYSIFAEIALALFVTVFIAVSIRTVFRSRKEIEQMARLPLEEGRKERSE
jgi:cytochrome c oxidase cbb3-type subunit IV